MAFGVTENVNDMPELTVERLLGAFVPVTKKSDEAAIAPVGLETKMVQSTGLPTRAGLMPMQVRVDSVDGDAKTANEKLPLVIGFPLV